MLVFGGQWTLIETGCYLPDNCHGRCSTCKMKCIWKRDGYVDDIHDILMQVLILSYCGIFCAQLLWYFLYICKYLNIFILFFQLQFETCDSTSTFNCPPVTSFVAWQYIHFHGFMADKFLGRVIFLSCEGILTLTMGWKMSHLAQLLKWLRISHAISVSWNSSPDMTVSRFQQVVLLMGEILYHLGRFCMFLPFF